LETVNDELFHIFLLVWVYGRSQIEQPTSDVVCGNWANATTLAVVLGSTKIHETQLGCKFLLLNLVEVVIVCWFVLLLTKPQAIVQ